MTLTVEQLEQRKRGIGGSDVAAALGVSPYRTPLDLYREKVGLDEPVDLTGNDAVHFGNVLEDTVASEFSRRTGIKLRRNNQHLVHPTHDILLANIDREVVGRTQGLRAGVECKTAHLFAAKPELWGRGATIEVRDGDVSIIDHDDQVPDWYLLQCVHYMAVTGSDIWFLACLIGGSDFRYYTIERDPELEAMVIDACLRFWRDHVMEMSPPDPVNQRDLETLYPVETTESVIADEATLAAWCRFKELHAQYKALEIEIEGSKVGGTTVGGLKNQIRSAMGPAAELLLDPDGKPLATWKATKPSRVFDTDAFKAAHPDLYQEFTTQRQSSRRLLIK